MPARVRPSGRRARRPIAPCTGGPCARLLDAESESVDVSAGRRGPARRRRSGQDRRRHGGSGSDVLRARAVVLTVGTFLGGRIHVGESNQRDGGRAGDPAVAHGLAARLRELPFEGRSAEDRAHRRASMAYRRLFGTAREQPGDDPRPVFSFLGGATEHPRQVPCHITHTSTRTHDIIRALACTARRCIPAPSTGVGPRYCPSIEDKIVRFADTPTATRFSSGARGPGHPRALSQRDFDQPAV